jgi:hypothetical protein
LMVTGASVLLSVLVRVSDMGRAPRGYAIKIGAFPGRGYRFVAGISRSETPQHDSDAAPFRLVDCRSCPYDIYQ